MRKRNKKIIVFSFKIIWPTTFVLVLSTAKFLVLCQPLKFKSDLDRES